MLFEDALPILEEILKLYRRRWTFVHYPWEDLCQDIRIHLFGKFHLYDQQKPIRPWLSVAVHNFIINEIRNRWGRFQPPCARCELNLGENQCKLYGTNLKKCTLYKKYLGQRLQNHSVEFPFSYEAIEYDSQVELSHQPRDFINSLYENISGNHKHVFMLFYESGFSTTKIAKTISISGLNFSGRFNFVELSLKESREKGAEILEDKKIAMGAYR